MDGRFFFSYFFNKNSLAKISEQKCSLFDFYISQVLSRMVDRIFTI